MRMFKNLFKGKRWIIYAVSGVIVIGVLASIYGAKWYADKQFQKSITPCLKEYAILVDEATDIYTDSEIRIIDFKERSNKLADDALNLKREVVKVKQPTEKSKRIVKVFLKSLSEMNNFMKQGDITMDALLTYRSSVRWYEKTTSSWIYDRSDREEALYDKIGAQLDLISAYNEWKKTRNSWKVLYDRLCRLVGDFERMPSSTALKVVEID